jgi:hypothetical protein
MAISLAFVFRILWCRWGPTGHFYLGGIEEEVLRRALHGLRVLLVFPRCSWLKMPQGASDFYSLAPAKVSIEIVSFAAPDSLAA